MSGLKHTLKCSLASSLQNDLHSILVHGICNKVARVQSTVEALGTLRVPAVVPGCGCTGFTPGLPQDLRNVVCRTLDSVRTARPLGVVLARFRT
jgi:hypothetical protein